MKFWVETYQKLIYDLSKTLYAWKFMYYLTDIGVDLLDDGLCIKIKSNNKSKQ